MALSICYALEKYGLTPAVKWPNDVQVSGKKISGILSEAVFNKTAFQAVVLGVGINVGQTDLAHVGQPATSLSMLDIQVTREEILQDVLQFFWQDYPALCEKGFETICAAYTQRFAALGNKITVKDGDKTIFGLAEGISPRGTLLLRTAQGLKEIYIGDVLV